VSSPITVSGLTNGKTYTCVVRAGNAVGWGNWSAPSGVISPDEVPDIPGITSTVRGSASVSVGFLAPSAGGMVLSFSVSCVSSDGGADRSAGGASSPITVSGLTNGKTYTCTVSATNAVGTGLESEGSSAFVAASVPGAPNVTDVAFGNAAVLVAFLVGGDGGSMVLSFTVTCTSLDGGIERSGAGDNSPISVHGLTVGTTYVCTVKATNAIGFGPESPPSIPVSVQAPEPPTITGVTRGDRSVIVDFSGGSTGGSPIVAYSAVCSSPDGGAEGSATGPASPITVGGLTNGKTYTCTVSTVSAAATGPESEPSVAVVPATVPGAPTILGAKVGNGSITVAFAAPDSDGGEPVIEYAAICVSNNGGAPGEVSGQGSPLTVSGLTNGKSYACSVWARNAIGWGSSSAAAGPLVPATVPGAPLLGAISLSGRTATVAVVAPAGNGGSAVTAYVVTCTSTNGGASRTGTRAVSPVTVLLLDPGRTYTCSARAVNAMGAGAPSPSSIALAVANLPGSPTQPTARALPTTGATGALSVSFSAPAANGGSPITRYDGQCSANNGVSWSVIASAPGSPVTVGGLVTGSAGLPGYVCRVRAVSAVGGSAWSALSVRMAVGSPAAPSVISVYTLPTSAVVGAVQVVFSPASGNGSAPTQYTVRCAKADGTGSVSASGGSSPVTVGGLAIGIAGIPSYRCAVRATNARGTGPESGLGPAFVVGTPAPPSGLSVLRIASGTLRIGFTQGNNNGSGILSYVVRCTSGNGGVAGQVERLDPNVTYTVTGLTPGRSYSCAAAARNARGLGQWSGPSGLVVA